MEKSPLKHPIVRCLFCFNPIVLADTNKHEVSKKQFGKVMEKSVATGCFKSKEAGQSPIWKNAGGTSPKIWEGVC